MTFTKYFNKWVSENEEYRITEVAQNRRKYHGKYAVSKKGSLESRYATTLKEAKQIASEWSNEIK